MNAGLLLDALSKIGDDPAHIRQLRKIAVALAVAGKLGGSSHARRGDYPTVNVEDLPADFNYPDIFTRLGAIARIEKGKTGIKQTLPGPFPMVVTGENRITCDHYDFEEPAAIVPLVSSAGHGKASLNRLHYQEGRFALGTILAAIFPHDSQLISARFIFEYLSAFKDELLVSRMIGTANVSLSIGKVAEVPIPLVCPEVQRKVDELMALSDRLEAARLQREATRDRLAAASLARLNTPDPETFQADARFAIGTALPALTTRPDQIKQLRQTILNLAVSGKLTQQLSDEGSGQALLTRISAHRKAAAHVAGVRLKAARQTHEHPAMALLPTSWAIEQLGNLVDPVSTISYGVLVPGPDVEDGIPFVRAQDLALRNHPIKPAKTIARDVEAPYARTRLRGGEILLCVVGSIGKLGIAPDCWAGANIARAVARISPIDGLLRDYLVIALQSEVMQGQFLDATRTVAQPTLNVSLLEALPVPLPPLAEQHRIVAKVDELVALCDQLEASLTHGESTRSRLLNALLHEALAPAESDLGAA